MPAQTKPIAVFDSGLGGISVLKELYRLMPKENYIYFGDSLHAPYGVKASEEVLRLTGQNIELLLKKGAKAMVLACNTATSAAVASLRQKYAHLPIIGMEPAIKPAIMATLHGRIMVMATEMTLREKKFSRLLAQYQDQAELILLPAPGIVNYVESGIISGPELDSYLNQLFGSLRQPKIDAIVLGCTHFPFVKDSIIRALGYPAQMFDGVEGTAKETQRQLAKHRLLNDSCQAGRIEFLNSRSDLEPGIIALCHKLFDA